LFRNTSPFQIFFPSPLNIIKLEHTQFREASLLQSRSNEHKAPYSSCFRNKTFRVYPLLKHFRIRDTILGYLYTFYSRNSTHKVGSYTILVGMYSKSTPSQSYLMKINLQSSFGQYHRVFLAINFEPHSGQRSLSFIDILDLPPKPLLL